MHKTITFDSWEKLKQTYILTSGYSLCRSSHKGRQKVTVQFYNLASIYLIDIENLPKLINSKKGRCYYQNLYLIDSDNH